VLRRLFLLLLLAALAASCKHDATREQRASSQSPVPAPATLIAEGTLRDPDALWGRLRRGGGRPFARMHDTAAAVLLAWAGADPGVAPLVAGEHAFHIVLGDSADGVAFAIAMKLKDVDGVRGALVEGDTARYRSEDVEGMMRLVPIEGAAPTVALAVSWAGYLVVASSVADLATLGPYAARTMPTKALPASAFELRMEPAALAQTGHKAPDLAAKATASIAATARGVLPPEVDASAVAECFSTGIRDTLATAGDLAEARVNADADDAQLDVVATLVPKPGDNGARRRLSAMHLASATALLDAPRDALAALFWSDTAQSRAEDVSTLGPCLGKALAPLLGPGGGPKLADVLGSWAHGRGDWETASFIARPALAGLVVRAPVADTTAVTTSVRGFVDLASQPALADAIERLLPLRAGAVQTIDVPSVGKASVLMFPPHAPPSRGTPDLPVVTTELAPAGLAWFVDAKEVDVALGQAPQDLLGLARPAAGFKTMPSVGRAVGALGGDVSFAAVVVPPGCCTAAGPASAPLTFGWGRREGNGRVTLAIGDEVLGQIVARVAAP
jgi:hypothetical protein